MGAIRFGVPRELVLWLRDAFNIGVFVETGTNQAETAVWASSQFERVLTIEADGPLHQRAVEMFGGCANIKFLQGDSRVHIKPLIASLQEPAIFWLDAHWCGSDTYGKSAECPVIDELELINSSDMNHVVLIDDARLFLAPPPLPHDASHWPDITTICGLLSTRARNRYVVVHDDVIVSVPNLVKPQLVEFIQQRLPKEVPEPPNLAVRRNPLRWTRSFIRRHLQ